MNILTNIFTQVQLREQTYVAKLGRSRHRKITAIEPKNTHKSITEKREKYFTGSIW